MINIIRDPMWQFIGALLALVAIVLSVILFLVQRKRKSLVYEIVSRTVLLSVAEEIEGKLEILYQGKPIRNVHLVVLRLINNGNTPIVSSDFVREVNISFGDSTRILTAEVSETNPERLDASVNTVENHLVLQPTLLNKGDSITIKMLLSQFDGKIEVDGRIVGVKGIERRRENIAFAWTLVSLLIAIASLVGALIIVSRINPEQPVKPMPTDALLAIGLMILSIIATATSYIVMISTVVRNPRYRRVFSRLLSRIF